MIAFKPGPRPCKQCGASFTPARPLAYICSPVCANRYVRAQKAADKAQTKARKEAIQTIPELIKLAQVAFNAFIRERDREKPCICCAQPLGEGEVGGAYDCGHYRSRGSASHLRFNEDNAHAQRKYCNRHGAGRAVDYRLGLVSRLGIDRVESLEANNTPKKWEREELRAIRATYTQKLKQIKKERA